MLHIASGTHSIMTVLHMPMGVPLVCERMWQQRARMLQSLRSNLKVEAAGQ